ncbi:glycosyltransferase family 2 protein [Sanyastnella coralliicola]|uniref:glycosyltransferase family 2 protein n=1 Tax=Sanyastnella coralliicola TaxID=3069118 RepID=UPI0027BA1E64|nr:glycosyltransferase family A protein [Longitalea sp. SCSIO 12813]
MVSLIITTYNYANYVERAIRSALEQSLAENQFEVIVVNDCSTDHTAEILENYEEEVRVFNLEKNVGLAGARNFGIKKAKGQFVMFLDADDYIHRDLLKVQKLFLEENNSLDAVSTDYWLVDERGRHMEHVSSEKEPIACGIMFRKDFLYNIGLYDEGFRAREEEDLRIRWLDNYQIYNIILPLYRYRMHDSNLTKDVEAMNKGAEMLQQKHSK